MNIVELENDIRERVRQIRLELEVPERTLAAGDEAAVRRINRQLSHGGRITLETLINVLECFPTITLNWLVYGTNEVKPGKETINRPMSRLSAGALPEEFVRELLQLKDRQIEALITALNAANQKIGGHSWKASDITKEEYPTIACDTKL
jgi:hypothetical protein